LNLPFKTSVTHIMLGSLHFKALMAIHGATKSVLTLSLFLLCVDNHALYCYVNSPYLLDILVLSNKGSVDGITDGLPIKGKGTFRFTIEDNNGRWHNFCIPKSLYVPGMKKCLLSPQHWAQTVANKKT
jgi:hypothetical protein